MLTDIAELAARDADQPEDALPPGEDAESMFLLGFVAALEELSTRNALATLRALAAVSAPDYAVDAHAAADRLAATGLREPSWAKDLGGAQPTAAALMREEAFDDGLSVMVEFSAPNVETHTIGIYIGHNMGGLVKDVFLAGALSEVRTQMGRTAPNQVNLAIRDINLAEARAGPRPRSTCSTTPGTRRSTRTFARCER